METLETDYKSILARYREPSLIRSVSQVLTTLIPLFGLWTCMYFWLDASYLALVLALPASLFLMRAFIIQHDCGHGSLFKSKFTNDILGMVCSVLTMTPYNCWRKLHAVHHATSGDLDRRGHGDINTLTIDEYFQLTPTKRFLYRLYRNPLVLFGIGPLFQFVVMQRFNLGIPKAWRKERLSTYLTNVLLLVTALAACYCIGFWKFALIFFPTAAVGASVGVWLFYVQHQYPEAYWETNEHWEYYMAGIKGSSYYALPKPLQWVTANIGIHHLHHLDHLIPNYRLQECMDNHPELRAVNKITLWQSLACARLKLWDENQEKMVTFREAGPRLQELKDKADEPAESTVGV